MAAVHASLLAKDINNNILAALPVEKMSAQALYNQRSVVQPGLISDLEEEVQHLIRFVALDGRTKPGGPLWCFPGVIPVVTHFCLVVGFLVFLCIPVVLPARAPDMLCQQFNRRCAVLVSFSLPCHVLNLFVSLLVC